jgi:hypothetical protein
MVRNNPPTVCAIVVAEAEGVGIVYSPGSLRDDDGVVPKMVAFASRTCPR